MAKMQLVTEEVQEAAPAEVLDCPECAGTGLKGSVLCPACGGNGKRNPNAAGSFAPGTVVLKQDGQYLADERGELIKQ